MSGRTRRVRAVVAAACSGALAFSLVAVAPGASASTAPTAPSASGTAVRSSAAGATLTAATLTAASATRASAKAGAKRCAVGGGVTAKQVIVVRAKGTSARGTVKACRRTAAGTYVRSLGPYRAYLGRGGIAKKNAKREGDGRTPSGVFAMRGGFGVYDDPGVRFDWFRTDSRDVWVDDPSSRYYNQHKRTPVRGRWSSAERLRVSPAYDYAQVIGYNEKRRPGRGSAIFLHVSEGKGTAGCVSLSRASLLKLLRWQKKSGVQMSIRRAKPAKKSVVAARAAAVTVATAAASAPAYTSSSRRATKKDVRKSWRNGCPVGPKQLRVLRIRYWGFDRKAHLGTLVVHKSVATDLRKAFRTLYETRFPIRRMRPVDHYGANDRRSMRADNTSAFNCRFVSGTSRWSNHAYGKAIDINPRENPYVYNGTAQPSNSARYVDRSLKAKGMIKARGRVVKVFRSLGFTWGGVWHAPDYQHFDHA